VPQGDCAALFVARPDLVPLAYLLDRFEPVRRGDLGACDEASSSRKVGDTRVTSFAAKVAELAWEVAREVACQTLREVACQVPCEAAEIRSKASKVSEPGAAERGDVRHAPRPPQHSPERIVSGDRVKLVDLRVHDRRLLVAEAPKAGDGQDGDQTGGQQVFDVGRPPPVGDEGQSARSLRAGAERSVLLESAERLDLM